MLLCFLSALKHFMSADRFPIFASCRSSLQPSRPPPLPGYQRHLGYKRHLLGDKRHPGYKRHLLGDKRHLGYQRHLLDDKRHPGYKCHLTYKRYLGYKCHLSKWLSMPSQPLPTARFCLFLPFSSAALSSPSPSFRCLLLLALLAIFPSAAFCYWLFSPFPLSLHLVCSCSSLTRPTSLVCGSHFLFIDSAAAWIANRERTRAMDSE
jgi:hypothetical protein